MTMTTMATGDDDNDVDGDGATDCLPPESGNSAENPEFRKMRTGINRNTGRNAQPSKRPQEEIQLINVL